MIPTNPELLNTIGAHEDLRSIRLDITRSAAYLISEEGYELELQCAHPVELHQLGSLLKSMTEGFDVKVYWGNGVDGNMIEHN